MIHLRSLASLRRHLPKLALSAAGILLCLGLFIVLQAERTYRQERIGQLTMQAHILAATVTAALAFDDRAAAGEYVAALGADPSLRAAAVYKADGSLFAGYRLSVALPLPPVLIPGVAPVEKERMIVTAPVIQNGALLGTVYVRILAEPLSRRLQRYGAIALLAVMASLVAAVLGIGQAALARANAELQKHAADLAEVNRMLEQQIEERERVEETLRQAQKMEAVGQLTGGIAHDFNNLLQVILGNLDVMRSRLPPEDNGLGLKLEAAQRAGERAAVLTAQLLAFARRQPLDARPIEINRLVTGMSNLLHRSLGEAIEIRTRLAPGLWWVSADANQLENALLNLAVNARDAMPGHGTLTIETRNLRLDDDDPALSDRLQTSECVAIEVHDTGTGMSPEVIEKAFEPFFTTKDIGRGTGLGLSQVYGFVKQSGGHIDIVSAPGAGATIRILLPRIADPTGRATLAGRAEPIPHGQEQELILLVEDDANVRMIGLEMLRSLGYRVIEAADGHEALRLLAAEPQVQLLFSDIGLPGGLSGRQLADRVRALRPDLPILLTTGYAHHAISQAGGLSPGIELLGKPFTHAALAQKIRQMLEPGSL
ncbi:MAG: putative two-component hybrid sensor and regulator [Rhodospirillales bacterium]|nr:putative two-component hybrid sensor and regulator [Rhodospirillales bacterium]